MYQLRYQLPRYDGFGELTMIPSDGLIAGTRD